MPDKAPQTADEKVLKTTPRIHARIKKISDETTGATMRSTTDLMLEWALPSFESGKIKLIPAEAPSE